VIYSENEINPLNTRPNLVAAFHINFVFNEITSQNCKKQEASHDFVPTSHLTYKTIVPKPTSHLQIHEISLKTRF
jgi:hypothetical protein